MSKQCTMALKCYIAKALSDKAHWLWHVDKHGLSLYKKFGCYNHWVVTLVEDKVRREWLWEVYFGIRGQLHKQSEPKSNLTTDNPQNTCEGVTSTIWCLCGDYLTDVQCLLYLQDHGCKVVCEPSSVVTIHNHCLLSLSATRVTTQWLKQPICFAVQYNRESILWRAYNLYCQSCSYLDWKRQKHTDRSSLLHRLSTHSYCKQQKAGRGLRTRLGQVLVKSCVARPVRLLLVTCIE